MKFEALFHGERMVGVCADPDEVRVAQRILFSWNAVLGINNVDLEAGVIGDLIDCCIAGARYSNALKEKQEAAAGGSIVDTDGTLSTLFMDWHDRTHEVLSKLYRDEYGCANGGKT